MIASVLKIFFSACLFFTYIFFVYQLLETNIAFSKVKAIVSCCVWSLICIITYQPIYNSVAPLISYITLSLVLSYIFQITIFKSAAISGIIYLTIALGDILGGIIASLSLGVILNLQRNTIFYICYGNIFVILFTLVITLFPFYRKTVKNFINKINYQNEKSVIIFIVLAIIAICFIDTQLASEEFESFDILLVIIPIIILFTLLIMYIFERNKYQVLNSRYEVLFTHATSLESWLENERLSYHEYKNQLAYIRSTIEEKEAIQYIDSILQESFENSSIIDTQIVNIPKGGMKGVIFYKLIQAQKRKIQTCVSISPRMKTLNIGKNIEKSKTVCRILGILLDNAIEAAVESDEKKISLEMYYLDYKFVFVVMNTFKGEINMIRMQEKGYTTKGNGHGNGLNYVKNIIAKDNGYLIQTTLIGGYYTQKLIINE